MKKNYYIVGFMIIIVILGIFYFLVNKKSDNLSFKSDKKFDETLEKYSSGANKIDYNITSTGFILKKPSSSKEVYFSGGVLNFYNKALTGSYINLVDQEINSLSGKYMVTIKNKNQKFTNNSGSTDETFNLIFDKNFTKMKLLGEKYMFDEKNINLSNIYDFELFISGGDAYVITFEDAFENKNRKKLYKEYEEKVAEIKNKYWNDPAMINNLVNQLNKEYNIDITKLK